MFTSHESSFDIDELFGQNIPVGEVKDFHPERAVRYHNPEIANEIVVQINVEMVIF